MSKLKDYVNELYRLDPIKLAKFANESYRLVHIKRRWWKGRRVIKDAEVKIDGELISEQSRTKSSWKLCPNSMKEQFSAFEKSLDQVIGDYCLSCREDASDGDGIAVLLQGGIYAVPASVWPRAQQILRVSQSSWSECADTWCNSDGYELFHKELQEQMGEHDYAKASNKLPSADVLRRSFGLMVKELPVLIAQEVEGESGNDGRATIIGEMLESAIRGPRMEAHEAWTTLADQLVFVDEFKQIKPKSRVRITGEGENQVKTEFRSVKSSTVIAAAKAATRIDKCGKAVDKKFRDVVDNVLKELSSTQDVASDLAKTLGKDDNRALELGKMLIESASVAEDENSMCDALAIALS